MRSSFHVLSFLIALCIPAFAFVAAQDIHVSIDPANPLYRRSAFAHGYIHGYERGYHFGNLARHMGQNPRDPEKIKEYKAAKSFYRGEFGNASLFEDGYRNSFRVGYIDAFAGREFRAASITRKLALGIDNGVPLRPEDNFDPAFASGYKQGRDNGLKDGRNATSYLSENRKCEASEAIRNDPKNPFCRAFSLGYALGYSDGYSNQLNPERNTRIGGFLLKIF